MTKLQLATGMKCFLLLTLDIGFSVNLLHSQTRLREHTLPKIAEVDPRYLSYNIETVEVTGGRFWKPFTAPVESQQAANNPNQPTGVPANLYRYRPPVDLSNIRLRKLASALAPAYLRVSGTWRNSTYFQNNDSPLLTAPPKGYKGVLSREQWKGVVSFAQATGSAIVTSVSISDGTRDINGIWTTDQAHDLFQYTKSIGGKIAAVEFMNEPTYPVVGGAPSGYTAEDFARDASIFKGFLKKESPDTIYLGPGSIGEGTPLFPGAPASIRHEMLRTDAMMQKSGPLFDDFSYHFYMSISHRCTSSLGSGIGMNPEDSLKAEWLQREADAEQYYEALRNKYLPGKPIWLTETGQAGCGGDRFAAEWADSFRFVHQLGTLAKKGVQAVFHNTLDASDYGLLNEDTLEPSPNYWAALLWKRTMGNIVLDAGVPDTDGLLVYAHCLRGIKGGIGIAVVNIDSTQEHSLTVASSGIEYTLSAPSITSSTVQLNGVTLKVDQDGTTPALKGSAVNPGPITFAPQTITFLKLPKSKNSACTSITY